MSDRENREPVGERVDGRPHGRWREWHANGQLRSDGHYDHGVRVGLWCEWDEQGRRRGEGHYDNGERAGAWFLDLAPPHGGFESLWHRGQLTNQPERAATQPGEHAPHYYPVVPGQLDGQQTPFDRVGVDAERWFARLRGGRFTYLFEPIVPVDYAAGAGLYLAIWTRYGHLQFFETRLTCAPGQAVAASSERETGRFVALVDPLRAVVTDMPVHATVAEATAAARALADAHDARVVVARFVDEFPLDH